MKAFETTGRVVKSGVLKLDHPLDILAAKKVKVIILYTEDEEIDETDWLAAVKNNPSFAFLKQKKEDIYSLDDGKPFNP